MSNAVEVNTLEYSKNSQDIHVISGFSDFEQFMEWAISENFQKRTNKNEYDEIVSRVNRAASDSRSERDWYGRPNYSKILANNQLRDYQDLPKLNNVLNKFTENIDSSLFSMIKKRKLRFNDRFGNFSFDRASAGLFILDEYYSPSQNAIVDERNVTKKNNAYFLKSDNSVVEKRKQQREDGSPYYKTSVRSVFAYFPEEPQQSRAVEIFSVIGHSWTKEANEILWSGIAAITVASILEQAGIPTKISGLQANKIQHDCFATIIPVKQFHETLDINQIAFILSDPAFFRIYGFYSVLHGYDTFDFASPPSLGAPITSGHKEMLQPYLDKELEQGTVPLFFPQVYSERDCENYIADTIRNLATLFNGSTP